MPRRDQAASHLPASVRDLRRQQIVAGARRIVVHKGLESLTFSALEHELGFSRGVITYHFRNKDEVVHALLMSAVEVVDAQVAEQAQRHERAADRVRAVLHALVDGFMTRQDSGAVLMSFWSRLRTDRRAARENAELYRRYRAQAAELLRYGVDRGEFTVADIPSHAALMVGTVIGLCTQAAFEPGCVDLTAAVDAAADTLLAHLGGAP